MCSVELLCEGRGCFCTGWAPEGLFSEEPLWHWVRWPSAGRTASIPLLPGPGWEGSQGAVPCVHVVRPHCLPWPCSPGHSLLGSARAACTFRGSSQELSCPWGAWPHSAQPPGVGEAGTQRSLGHSLAGPAGPSLSLLSGPPLHHAEDTGPGH